MKRVTSTKGRACKGKVRHTTRPKALAHLRRLLSKGGVRLAVYACDFCGGYHVGHLPKPRHRR